MKKERAAQSDVTSVVGSAQMSSRRWSVNEALVVAGFAAGTAYASTYITKHYVPGLWFLWLGSGAVIAFALSWWKPAYWALAAASTPSLVLLETFWKVRDAPPTAAALRLGFAACWTLMSVGGALMGRMIAPKREREMTSRSQAALDQRGSEDQTQAPL
jgi:hypothetical protein